MKLLLLSIVILAISLPNLLAFKIGRSQRRNIRVMVTEDEGYGPVGSLLRQGPVPFFIRLVQPTKYEEAVKKYMALEKCSRVEAQGNMDYYFEDPNGWAANKLREKRTGVKVQYGKAEIDPTQLILTATWAGGFSFLCYRIFVHQVLEK